MCMHGPIIVEGAVQMDATLLCYASAIMKQKNPCWELLGNNLQQGVQTGATCNIQRC